MAEIHDHTLDAPGTLVSASYPVPGVTTTIPRISTIETTTPIVSPWIDETTALENESLL